MNDVVPINGGCGYGSHEVAPVAVGAVSTQELTMKLAEMKQQLQLVQTFFKEVMIKGQDFGVIPGTDKPTLYKSGAEKLAEFYGYAPIIKDIIEEKNIETGFYRCRVVLQLVHKRTGAVIAEGVGEANTMESKFRYRWVPDFKLPNGINKEGLYCEKRTSKKGKEFLMYRLENQDPWSLWNNVTKQAKKRAFVDATLSATRSSGLFTQDLEDLEEWVGEAEEAPTPEVIPPPPVAQPAQPAQPRQAERQTGKKAAQPAKPTQAQAQAQTANGAKLDWGKVWALANELGLTKEQVYAEASRFFNVPADQIKSLTDVIKTEPQLDSFADYLQAVNSGVLDAE